MTRAELAALVGAMSEGPWKSHADRSDPREHSDWIISSPDCVIIRETRSWFWNDPPRKDEADMAGIVALRNHAEKLLAVCEAAEAVDPRAWTCLSGGPNEWEALDKLRAALRDLEGA